MIWLGATIGWAADWERRMGAKVHETGRREAVAWTTMLALMAALVWRLLPAAAGAASAQEVPDPEAPASASPGSWLDRLSPGEWFEQQRDALFQGMLRLFTDPEQGLPALLGRWVQGLLRTVWDALAGLFAPFNVFTQIPTWVVGMPFIETAWGVLFPIATVALGLAAVLTLGMGMLSIMGGRPPDVLFSGLRHFVRATGGLLLGTRLYLTLIDVSNSLVGRFLDPTGGLPGLDRMTAVGQAVTFPVLAVLYVVFAVAFFFVRIKVVLTVVVCLILAPVAFVLGALPFKRAQDAYDVWLTYATASAFVQVVQAVFLGLGANILLHGTGGTNQGVSEMTALVVGVGAITAAGAMPGMLLGAMLNRSLVPPGTLHNAAAVGVQLASLAALLRMPVIPPMPPGVYPPPTKPPTDAAFTTGRPTPRLIEYVPPMLPPPRD